MSVELQPVALWPVLLVFVYDGLNLGQKVTRNHPSAPGEVAPPTTECECKNCDATLLSKGYLPTKGNLFFLLGAVNIEKWKFTRVKNVKPLLVMESVCSTFRFSPAI